MAMTAAIRLLAGMVFRATTGSGHSFTIGATAEAGGASSGPLPMEMLLAGLGGSTGMNVVSVLRKMRCAVTSYEVVVTGEQADFHPKILREIVVEHVVRGPGLSADAVRRAVELSSNRYCSVATMLVRAARIEVRYRAIDETTGLEGTGSLWIPTVPRPSARDALTLTAV